MKNKYFKGKFFTTDQMREILKGLSDRIDADVYANPSYTAQMMRKIRFKLLKTDKQPRGMFQNGTYQK